MQLLALDFDGVISDSAPEAFLVALRAYCVLRPRSTLSALLERLGGGDRAALTGDPLYQRFVAIMPLGNRAEDYAVELAALESGVALEDQAAYDRYKSRQSVEFLATFHGRFYEERSGFAQREPERWQSLIGPYPAFVALLRRRAADALLALATAKDRESVDRLLAAFGIADLFPADRVLDKEAGVSKRAHLEALRRRTGAPFAEITFVDDKVNHLEDVASLGVRCVLAAWGYNSERERRRARQCGFAVCTLDEAEELLFGG